MIRYMSKHPDFEGGCLKCKQVGETFYFSGRIEVGVSWNQYIHFFPQDVPMTGESTVAYLVHCKVPERIFRACGHKAKVVMLLRNPVDRLVSNFLMRADVGGLYGDDTVSPNITSDTLIHDTVQKEIQAYFHQLKVLTGMPTPSDLVRNWTPYKCLFDPGCSMIFEGMYYLHLMNWLCNFPAENILIVNSEELFDKTSTPKVLEQVVEFLGLRPLSREEYEEITSEVYNNRTQYHAPPYQVLSESDREELRQVFKPFNKALMKLLDWDIMWT